MLGNKLMSFVPNQLQLAMPETLQHMIQKDFMFLVIESSQTELYSFTGEKMDARELQDSEQMVLY
jgi:hypothetical protein